MKFLHTADLHLGRLFHERSLLEDQEHMLNMLVDILQSDDYSGLILAGDIYDRSIPSPDAVSLLGSFMTKLRFQFPDLSILMIPGNHDSAERLGFGRELFGELNIHIGSSPEEADKPFILEKNGEQCAIFLLPFLNPGALHGASEKGELPLRSQQALAEEAASRLKKAREKALEDGAQWTLLVAHLFTTGGMESESERIFLGTAERVSASLFSGFDHVALGHLHRKQKAAENAWYSGSPLAYSFDEADQEKCVLRVELRALKKMDKRVELTPLPLKPLRQVRRLSGSFDSFYEGKTIDTEGRDFKDAFLELELTDASLVENPLALLRSRFPNLLAVRQKTAFGELTGAAAASLPQGLAGPENRRGAVEDFEAFLTDLYGHAEKEKLNLFRELAQEAMDASE